MRVAIVHDDLVQWGGAERVLEGLCEIFPDAPIYTSVFDKENLELQKRFGSKVIRTSFLQDLPGRNLFYKTMLPLYGIAFEQFDFSEFDLIISHTTRFAKSIITKPKTKHICYCHTPPRFLWKLSNERTPKYLETFLSKLRIYDSISARRVDYFLAGSKNAAIRIKKIYKKDSKVLFPFIDLDRFKNVESWDGGYFVVIARLNKYKRVDLAVSACLELGVPLKIIGSGSELENFRFWASQNDKGNLIEFLGNLDDDIVVQVLAGCKALIMPGVEDFGLTSLEAQALGKPVIAYQAGGALETVIEGKTGILFQEQTVESLIKALLKISSKARPAFSWDPEDCRSNAKNYGKSQFAKKLNDIIYSYDL